MKPWEVEEAEMSTRVICLYDDLAILPFLFYFYQAVCWNGLLSGKTGMLIALFVLFRLVFGYLRAIKNPLARFWVVFALAQACQGLIIFAVVSSMNENFPVNLINSTVFLMISEISPIHSQLVNFLIITKHLGMWIWAAHCRGLPGDLFSMIPALWCFWNLLHAQALKRKLLIAKKEAEENRLEALLCALPDGVVVLDENMKVLTWNPAVRRKLGVENSMDSELKATFVISNLEYDPEYMEKTEEIRIFGNDLKALLKKDEGAVDNFKPVLLENRYLECRGCVIKWDGRKVLILTIRNITTWVQLEKAAKRDSANKTALIRSVSHELRTPVNAIINLCQDLQSSETIEEHDREDVEILANASHFLLSMINDLLDYSRILHDKFTLVKTNFDLKHLIRSCGQLIGLQCKQKQVDFIVRYDPFLPKFAYSDENRLKQIILNLLSNAAK
jgi:nitrogen-specific signal transduction histidine kinase